MCCLTPCCLVREGLLRNWSGGRNRDRQMSYDSTRHHTWRHGFKKVVKQALRQGKRVLQNEYVFRWAVLILRLYVEIRRLLSELS